MLERLALAGALCMLMAGYPPAMAAHAAIGTAVADAELPSLDGARTRVLADSGASVLVFFRTGQSRSVSALRELAKCRTVLGNRPARWVGLVPDSTPAKDAEALIRESGLRIPVLFDTGDAVYGSLGLALHPVVVIVGSDRRLAAFEPFQTVDFCTVVSARLRRSLGEISDEQLQGALSPPPAARAGTEQGARRYRNLAESLYKAGNLDEAVRNARKSIDLDPGAAASHALLGDIQAARGLCDTAIPSYRQALALDGANSTAIQGLERCKSAR